MQGFGTFGQLGLFIRSFNSNSCRKKTKFLKTKQNKKHSRQHKFTLVYQYLWLRMLGQKDEEKDEQKVMHRGEYPTRKKTK